MKIFLLWLGIMTIAMTGQAFADDAITLLQKKLSLPNEDCTESQKITYCQYLISETCLGMVESYEYENSESYTHNIFKFTDQWLRAAQLAYLAGYPVEHFARDFGDVLELCMAQFEQENVGNDTLSWQIAKFSLLVPPSSAERYSEIVQKHIAAIEDQNTINGIVQATSFYTRMKLAPSWCKVHEYWQPCRDAGGAYQAAKFVTRIFFEILTDKTMETKKIAVSQKIREQGIAILEECTRYILEHDENLEMSFSNYDLTIAWLKATSRSIELKNLILEKTILQEWDQRFIDRKLTQQRITEPARTL